MGKGGRGAGKSDDPAKGYTGQHRKSEAKKEARAKKREIIKQARKEARRKPGGQY